MVSPISFGTQERDVFHFDKEISDFKNLVKIENSSEILSSPKMLPKIMDK